MLFTILEQECSSKHTYYIRLEGLWILVNICYSDSLPEIELVLGLRKCQQQPNKNIFEQLTKILQGLML